MSDRSPEMANPSGLGGVEGFDKTSKADYETNDTADVGLTQTSIAGSPSPVAKNGTRAALLLSGLQRVKRTGEGTWLACCPAHDDEHGSLSVRELPDGTVLVKCWTGCGALEVLEAAGVDGASLFPPPTDAHSRRGEFRPIPPGDILCALGPEILIVLVASSRLTNGHALSDADRERLLVAYGRIQDALEASGYAPTMTAGSLGTADEDSVEPPSEDDAFCLAEACEAGND